MRERKEYTWRIVRNPTACSNFALSNIRGKNWQEVRICKLGILKSGFCILFYSLKLSLCC